MADNTAATATAATAAAHATTPSPAAPVRRPRLLRWLLWATVDLLALALILLAALLWWASTDQSLAQLLAQAPRFLPAGQKLESREVSGSLRAGGQIGWLRWSSPTLAVEIKALAIGWRLRPLLHGELQLTKLHAQSVQLEDHSPPSDSPLTPLQTLQLPLHIQLPLQIDALHWSGSRPVQASAVQGRYHYDGAQHQLTLERLDWADGEYRAQLQLQGAAPMALDARLDGQIRSRLPGSSGPPRAISASAQLQGTLAGHSAALQLKATLQPESSNNSSSTPNATPAPMQAELQAQIAPWASQPLLQAQAQFSALNLAQLWPQAPATLLRGRLNAGPQPDATAPSATSAAPAPQHWQLQAELYNSRPAPWNQGGLPLDQLQADIGFDGSSWDIRAASLRRGPGEISLQGRWSPAPQPNSAAPGSTPAPPWQLRANVRQLSPALLHSQLAPAPLNGRANLAQSHTALDFDIQLEAVQGPSAPAQTLRLDRLAAQGQWHNDLLTLQTLYLRANQAQLQGQLRVHTRNASAQGQLALSLPGAQAQLKGQLAATEGQGQFELALSDAAQTQRWLQSLPALPALPGLSELQQQLASSSLHGQATLDGQWHGGWQTAQQQLRSGPTPRSAAFTLQAKLKVPQFTRQPGPGAEPAAALQLRDLHAELAGHLGQASLSLAAEVHSGQQQLRLQTKLHGGKDGQDGKNAQNGRNNWRLDLDLLQLQLEDSAQPGPWTLQLDQPSQLRLRTHSDNGTQLSLQVNAGSASLSGPQPGRAQLSWAPLHYGRSGTPAQPHHQLQTKGQLQGLPLAWAQALSASGDAAARNLGLRGDILLAGEWDIDYGQSLRAHAELRRSSGDLQLQNGELPSHTVITSSGASLRSANSTAAASARALPQLANGPATSAGIRQARLRLDLDGNAARAQVHWDSERAGQLEAEVSSQLSAASGNWSWPADAALHGKIRAQLPSIGAWAMLAPPGWRLQGTLDANAELSGSRSAPRWNGTLAADGLSLRSVVDGVDLQRGRLRAVLRGEQLDITELTLHGGSGNSTRISGFSGNRSSSDAADGGRLSGRGNLNWGQASTNSAGIRMQFDAQATALRVLVRSDRQMSLSGSIQASLNEGQIRLRAKLRTDRAAIILPDDTAPRLGDDVVVRSAASPPANTSGGTVAAARPQTTKPPDIAISFNLGDDFAVQGHGLTTRLRGELDIRSTQGLSSNPRVSGEIRTDSGKYRAYGQQLDIETGLLHFNGALDNPALDILALRPSTPVRAGVHISGSAQAPRVRLYSDPVLPDAEILSWVVLGHGSANGGAEAALLQQAALTLLGQRGAQQGGMASRLGLDAVGFRSSADNEGASGAVLTVGKRISQDIYVSFESGLSGAIGTLYIFYDLSRHLTLRAQAGNRSAIDLIYTVSFDGARSPPPR